MRQIGMESDDPYEVIDILFTFMDDVYKYLGIELPEYFDPDEELVNIVQAIMDKKNALQKS
jgi:hypothetical protein